MKLCEISYESSLTAFPTFHCDSHITHTSGADRWTDTYRYIITFLFPGGNWFRGPVRSGPVTKNNCSPSQKAAPRRLYRWLLRGAYGIQISHRQGRNNNALTRIASTAVDLKKRRSIVWDRRRYLQNMREQCNNNY